jgi:hypothetical protein
MHDSQRFALLALAVDILTDAHEPNVVISKLVSELQRILNPARQTGTVVNEHYVKGFFGGGSGEHQPFQPSAVCRRAADRPIFVQMFGEHFPSLSRGILAALSILIVYARRRLSITRISGVDRASKCCHHFSPLLFCQILFDQRRDHCVIQKLSQFRP